MSSNGTLWDEILPTEISRLIEVEMTDTVYRIMYIGMFMHG